MSNTREIRKTHDAITREFEFPDTVFIRDIENRVFQTLIVQCLSKVKGVSLLEGGFIDNILGRDSIDGVKGIYAEQDNKNNSVSVRVEVNIAYGIPIPAKAIEVQTKLSEEITKLTGLHVSSVHVVVKNVLLGNDNAPVIVGVSDDDKAIDSIASDSGHNVNIQD